MYNSADLIPPSDSYILNPFQPKFLPQTAEGLKYFLGQIAV